MAVALNDVVMGMLDARNRTIARSSKWKKESVCHGIYPSAGNRLSFISNRQAGGLLTVFTKTPTCFGIYLDVVRRGCKNVTGG